MSIIINILLAINVLVSLFIILIVLMQRPKSEGLGAAFGGGMTENIFGAGTTNALQTITRYLGAIFFFLSIALSWLYIKQSAYKSTVQQRLLAPTVVPAPATPVGDRKPETGDRKGEATPAASAPSGTPAAPGATPAPGAATAPATPAPATTSATPAPSKPATPAPAAASSPAPAKSETSAPEKPAQAPKPADKGN